MFEKWKRKLKEKLHRANQDDRGSSFVVVIIGIMALTIVGATILSVATNYVITVIVDQNVTDNFYDTEGVMGEIRSGIEEICGEANEYAYMEVINHYNAASDPSDGKLSSKMDTMKDKYAVKYLTGIVSMLNKPTITTMSDSLNEFDNTMSGWDGTNQEKEDWQSFPVATLDKVKKMVTRPATVGSTYTGNQLKYGFCIKREDDDPDGKIEEMYLVISGLKVDYKDQDGYRSVVQTDIRIDVPDYGFEGNATLDEMRKYIVICDRKLSVSTVELGGSTVGIDFNGSVYAGGDFDASGNYGTGIEIKPKAQNITFMSDTLISRGDLTVNDKANVNVSKQDGELWIKNVILSGNSPAESPAPGSTTKLQLNTNSYVLDDLSIDNNNCEVDLGEKYYGYSYNEKNENTGDATEASYSSAILVNGKNTTLLSDHLSKLILAGRTFVSRDMTDGTEPDIMMGESLAVKSNQIAYLVPDSCIKAEHNPLTSEEATLAGGNWQQAVDQTKLEQTIAWPYLNTTEPVTFNYVNGDPGYAFLYLNFKSQKAANDYFSTYYGVEENEAMLRDRAETYISTADNEGMKLGAHLYLIAGNIIHNYYSTTGKSVKQDANYFDGTGAPNEGMLLDGRKKMQNYLGKQLTLVNSGYKTGMRTRYELLTGAQKKELVRDEIVDFDAINNADAGIMDIQKNNTDTAVGGTLFITPGDYTVDGSITKGLIISGGTVTVNRDFEGLILAKDKVIVNGSKINLVSNASMVGSLMDMVEKDPELSKYFHKLKKEEKDDTTVADCISYENWKRDSEDQL